MERGALTCDGVENPGVAGGVKAGDIRGGAGSWCTSLAATSLCNADRTVGSVEVVRSKASVREGLEG
jgi:hypothetical protein